MTARQQLSLNFQKIVYQPTLCRLQSVIYIIRVRMLHKKIDLKAYISILLAVAIFRFIAVENDARKCVETRDRQIYQSTDI